MERMSGQRMLRRICGLMIAIGTLTATFAGVASASAAERSLAGIKIFSPMSLVLKRYGTPTEVRVGAQSTEPGGANGQGGGGMSPYGPGGGGAGNGAFAG